MLNTSVFGQLPNLPNKQTRHNLRSTFPQGGIELQSCSVDVRFLSQKSDIKTPDSILMYMKYIDLQLCKYSYTPSLFIHIHIYFNYVNIDMGGRMDRWSIHQKKIYMALVFDRIKNPINQTDVNQM